MDINAVSAAEKNAEATNSAASALNNNELGVSFKDAWSH
jgi:hypothetical protein